MLHSKIDASAVVASLHLAPIMVRSIPRSGLATVVFAAASIGISAAATLSKQDADNFARKIGVITQHSAQRPQKQSRLTLLSEDELNAYLKFHAAEIRSHPGSSSPTSASSAREAGGARDRRSRRRAAEAEFRWLARSDELYAGQSADHALRACCTTAEGVGRFTPGDAEISGIIVPKTRAAADARLLLAHPREPRTASTSTTRSSCPPPSARSGSARPGAQWFNNSRQ